MNNDSTTVGIIGINTKPTPISDTAPLALDPTPTPAAIAAIPPALIADGKPKFLFEVLIQNRQGLGSDLLRHRDLAAEIQKEETRHTTQNGWSAQHATMWHLRADLKAVVAGAVWHAQVVAGLADDLEAFVGKIAREKLILTPPPMPKDGVPWDKAEMASLRERHAKLAESGKCSLNDMRQAAAAVREAVNALNTERFVSVAYNASALLKGMEQAKAKR